MKKKKNSAPRADEQKKPAETTMEDSLEAAAANTEEISVILTQTEDTTEGPSEADLPETTESNVISPEIPSAIPEPAAEAEESVHAEDDAVPESEPISPEVVSDAEIPQPVENEQPLDDGTAKDEPAGDPIPAIAKDETAEKPTESADSTAAQDYKKLGIYLHVPFCKSKCAYCDFYSTDKIVCSGHKIPEEMRLYCTALKNNMRIISERTTQYNVDTVFIGGGTPTALPAKLLLDIVKEVDRCFYLDDNFEFTIEMNPATADARLLKKLRRAGVNRLSIGLQSAQNHELAALSRIHTVGDFTECFQMAREAGFTNINIDVMYGIPEQTKDTFMETLAFAASMKPEHISMYNLRIEDGTPFGEKKHMLPLPDEDTECDMYFDGIAYLESQGYHQYEISNFARDGYECRHNLKYWHGEEYIGCGPASHSFFGGNRFSLRRSLPQFCKALEVKGKSIPSSLLDESYAIDKKEEVAEYLMLRLRLKEGISVHDFQQKFGADFDEIFGKKLQIYIDRGFMTHENGRYAFTPQGMFVSNYILSRIIPFSPKYAKSGIAT